MIARDYNFLEIVKVVLFMSVYIKKDLSKCYSDWALLFRKALFSPQELNSEPLSDNSNF